MKKLLAFLLAVVFGCQVGGLQVAASGTAPWMVFPASAKRVVLPNGYMAYFEKIGEHGERIDSSVSGVYSNWGAKKLLYEIDYTPLSVLDDYGYGFSADGVYYVMWSGYPHFTIDEDDGLKTPAVTFFKDGKEIKSWTLGDFGKEFKWSTAGVEWLRYGYGGYDYVNEVLHIKTVEGWYYSFDIYTGEIIYKSKKDPFGEITVGSSVIITDDYYYDPNYNLNDDEPLTIPTKIRCSPHKVSQIVENRALLDADGGICSWVPIDGVVPFRSFR